MSLVTIRTLHPQEDSRGEGLPVRILPENVHAEELPEAARQAGARTKRAKAHLSLLQQELRLRRQPTGTDELR